VTARTTPMTRSDALARARHAHGFLTAAELVGEFSEDVGDDAASNVVASLAVLAGIAAGDAICGVILRRRSSSSDHSEAVRLLSTAGTNGVGYSRDLRRLIASKSVVQYSPRIVTAKASRELTAYARRLVEGMERELSAPTS